MGNLKNIFMKAALLCLVIMGLSACTAENVLKAVVDEANEEMTENPQVIDEGMVIDGLSLGDKAVVYHVSVDEDYYDMDALQMNKAEIRREMENILREEVEDDQDIKTFIQAVADANKGITFKYEGNVSPGTVRIEISPVRVKTFLK